MALCQENRRIHKSEQDHLTLLTDVCGGVCYICIRWAETLQRTCEEELQFVRR